MSRTVIQPKIQVRNWVKQSLIEFLGLPTKFSISIYTHSLST
jgi:hypothetical protein